MLLVTASQVPVAVETWFYNVSYSLVFTQGMIIYVSVQGMFLLLLLEIWGHGSYLLDNNVSELESKWFNCQHSDANIFHLV